ncbi:MAG: hypothetical protein EBS84_18150 [Proteobacteria bacterium]|nr:hypothetical protein [Verrucomicrobiota bacterium]NBU10913.1 hypothetical protein [Pseudomonadota bacterium]
MSGPLPAAEPTDKLAAVGNAGEAFVFKTSWKGERITLPPGFAPAMKLKGIEEIRFAPGMFQPQSDSFFSYAIVFSVAKDQALSPEVIQREILVYYQGLAESVSKSQGRTVDAGKFTFKLDRAKQATGAPAQLPPTTPVTQYAGELDWVEPFATGKPQVLHFEIQAWSDSAAARNYLFVCTSPTARTETTGIWSELRTIRRTFEIKSKPNQ